MTNKNNPSKILCIVYFVAATLCIIATTCTAFWLKTQLNDTHAQLLEAESLVDAYSRDLNDVRKALEAMQADNKSLQRDNDELRKALAAYDYDFNIAAPTPPSYLDVPVDKDLQDFIWSMCCDYDVEDHYVLIYAIMRQESNFKSDVISATNDYGLMQINISNHGNLSQRLGINDFLDPYQNVQAGIYMIANALHRYGSVSDALMAYNLGGGGASKLWSQGIHSTNYSRSVLSYYEQFTEDI